MSNTQVLKIRRRSHNLTNWLLIVVCLASGMAWWSESNKREQDASDFREATRAASAGRWFYDLKAEAKRERMSLRWDDVMFKVFGRDPKNWSPDYGGFESCIIEEDKAIARRRVNEAITTRTGYSAVFRAVGDDGKIRYVMAWAYVDPTGSYMTGICVPLTGQVYKDMYNVLPPTMEAPPEAESFFEPVTDPANQKSLLLPPMSIPPAALLMDLNGSNNIANQ